MTTEKQPLDRQTMANRLAMEFHDGWVVNLGIGIPTLCSNFVHPDRHVVFQSENGLVNYGPLAERGEEDPNLVNAGGQYVVEMAGMAILDHADSFALIRGGYVDVTVLGAYEVAANGDFANWKVAGAKGGGIGGAMTLPSARRTSSWRWSTRRATADPASSSAARCPSPRWASSSSSPRTWACSRSRSRGSCSRRSRPATRLRTCRPSPGHSSLSHRNCANFAVVNSSETGANTAMLYLSQAVSGRRTGWIRSTGWNGWPRTTR